MITSFFHKLTVRNWGFPWHIILSWFGVNIFETFLHIRFAMAIVLVCAVGYELYQLRTAKRDIRKDSMEDMLANVTGILLGWLL